MKFLDTPLSEVKIVIPRRIGDSRGFFSEVWAVREFRDAGIDAVFVQDNHTRSKRKHTVRGLHYQIDPACQGKLVRVSSGAIFDVVVDVRRGSPTFGNRATAILSADNWHQIWIPAGFAHGYCTLENDTEVQYKVTSYYSPDHDRGIAWNDPALGIAWPVGDAEALLSDRDRKNPHLADQPDLP